MIKPTVVIEKEEVYVNPTNRSSGLGWVVNWPIMLHELLVTCGDDTFDKINQPFSGNIFI